VELQLPARKERALLAFLALRAGSDVSAAELTRALWGDEPPRSATKTLQTYVSALRRVLPPHIIETTPGGYRLAVSPDEVDAHHFEQLLRAAADAAEAGDMRRAADDTRAALALWRGSPLPDLADHPTGMAESARLAEMHRTAEERNFAARLALGEHAELIGDLETAVGAEPLRERRWEQLMVALYRSGRQSEALRAYQRLRTVLGEELGLEPGEEARALEAAILAHAPDIGPHLAVGPGGAGGPDGAGPGGTDGPGGAGDPAGTGGPGGAGGPDVVGPAPPEPVLNVPTRPPLPSGNVTFLFTDIEGSTSMFHRLGTRYEGVLETHRHLLRAVIAGHDGVEVNTEGDGMSAAFADAGQAIGACLDGQRNLAAENWPEGGEVRVRMGLHTGVARPTPQGDYVAVAMHEAARICAAAHGGQVLLSSDTARMVRPVLPPEADLVDRGPFRLSGFEEPEQIYQLSHPALRSGFPPLRASPAQSHNLPNLRMPFVGREADLEAVGRILSEARLITVVGPGGAGKTRLAVEAAARLAARFQGGVHLCDLSTQTDPGLVEVAISEAFGLRDSVTDDRMEEVAKFIEERTALLVLDSCEHLMMGVAAAVDALLALSPALRVLATSREPLGVDGEHLWRLGSLQVPDEGADLEAIKRSDAVVLFEGRARLVQPTFAITATNAATVADICRQLDGLPLALELAAAQAGSLSPAAIAERLTDSMHMLAGGSDRRSSRHRTLDSTVDWSYRLLDEDARRLMRRLAVFANGFTIDAARSVSDAADPVAVLTRLVDKSLVIWDADAARYRMLEPIRAFARARLEEAGEADAAAARHLAWCASLADSLRNHSGPRQETYDLFGREMDNFRVALVWAASHSSPDGTRLAVAFEAEGAAQPVSLPTWELVVRADRDYFDRVEADDVEFPAAASERLFQLEGDRATIGRRSVSRGIHPDVDLSAAPTDTGISHQHAILVNRDGAWAIIDPGATNGVYLNDSPDPLPRNQLTPVGEDDQVHIGAWTTLILRRRG
jgi:predicted ATPase/DNA-binding SARP family transcriptional activator/class 3 adenylate cyclase